MEMLLAAIINYDETCFVDDPGKKKVVVRRGSKHPERIMDSTKSNTSVMFSATGSGELLPPFIVCNSEHLYRTWIENGLKGARYRRNKSGWFRSKFDQALFEEWFYQIALPYLKRQEGERLIIGDNLASHLSFNVIQLCEEHNIKFYFLPANLTHLTQPLDVAVFRAIKISWRKKLETWKKKYKGSLPKEYFPNLLASALNSITNMKKNILSGFAATGIVPCDRQQVLKRLPNPHQIAENVDDPHVSKTSLINIFQQACSGEKLAVRKRKKIVVEPGKNVGPEDLIPNNDLPSTSKYNETPVVDKNRETEEITETEQTMETEETLETEEVDDPLVIENINQKRDSDHDVSDYESDSGESELASIENVQIEDFVEVCYKTNKNRKFYVGIIKSKDKKIKISCLRPNRKMQN